ncbi:MAG: hypothetical protein Q4Q62_05250 [Thermoplasmata archaeon]|nr:hypothetical protein [Thermoplasmata archaeon]
MDGCVGREKEMQFLCGLWEKTPVACAVCGRRHLGKTSLLKEFTADKDYIYITGTQGLRSDNLEEINRALSEFSGRRERISDVGELFPRLKEICGRRKVVVIIDRLADLAENFEEINAYLRNFINREMGGTKIMLVVCDNDNSLFGRFYYTLELKPMTYLECKGFHPEYTPLQHLKAYAIAGGTPAYQHLFDGKDPDEVIRRQMFYHMSVFSLEAEGLVSTEALSLGSSTKVLSAIAGGAESVRQISARTSLASSYCNKIVEDMEHKGILGKEVSSGASRRAVYSIKSNILAFYYRVVYRYTHMVEFESPEKAYEMARADIDGYMEGMFKAVCMDYVARTYEYKFIGKLRRKDDTVDDVIDFLASFQEGRSTRTMVAACRLYGEPMDRPELDGLTERARKVDHSDKMRFLFSGCGFTPALEKAAAKDPSVRLISLDDVYAGR